ncbi:sulfite exporter TauE/SafE family protein [Amylibacter sp. SFDW26]|uniref:sulfite exporter TauE/SafE family protein n=1 Tax=Amylibacter sp. SFDW26 TaxID=2652722 RepID=UPI0012615A2E|nr:sulfite exporter TauE/SafE family protein [Amylibacter sp. SFDW26]KAB7614331.1 sulfite exporter TauE/SafE family protein [Amylibacter sp. SFDW26]
MTILEVSLLVGLFFIGGFVKGTLGIGLPALLVGFLTFIYEPRVAVAIIVFPIMVTNVRQALVGGSVWPILKSHWMLCISACIAIFFMALIGGQVSVGILQTCVGLAMVVFSLTSLFGSVPVLNEKYNTPAQLISGAASGILGGLTAIWSPPLVVYLMSLRLDNNIMIKTLGVMFAVQSFFLVAGFTVSGELTPRLALIGILMLIPTFAGMYFGEKQRARMNMAQFTRAFLILFLLLGLNLMRRGLFGA